MLVVDPKSLLSWSFDVSHQGRHLASLSVRWLREAGQLALGGRTYQVGREGWMSGDFYIEGMGERIATATKAITRRFEVSTDTARYVLRAESPFRRAFVLEQSGRVIGSIRPRGFFVRKARVELPEQVSLETQLFLTWLVLVIWRRAARNNS